MNHSRLLPMPDVGDQRLLSGAIGTPTPTIGRPVWPMRMACFDATFRHWLSADSNPAPFDEIDSLDLPALTAEVFEQLSELDGLFEATTEGTSLRHRFAPVFQLASQKPSASREQAKRIVNQVVDGKYDRLRERLERGFAKSPQTVAEQAEQVRSFLASLTFARNDRLALDHLKRCLTHLEAVSAGRVPLADEDLPKIRAELLQHAQTGEREVVKAVSKEMVSEAMRRAKEEFDPYLDREVASGAELQKRLRQMQDHLHQQRNAAAEQKEDRTSSVVYPLEGASEAQVMSGILSHWNCSDTGELGRVLSGQFETLLRQAADELCPWVNAGNTSLPRLLLEISSDVLAAKFAELIQHSVGEGQTLYSAIEHKGVESVARALYQRAEHTCHLGDWAQERFNVPAVELTIVRLPPPSAHSDHRLYKALEAAFDRLAPCMIRRGSAADHSVTVVRVKLGFPIGIEQAGWAFSQGYFQSASQGHLPHLLGVHPDTHDGKVIPDFDVSD